MKSAMNGEQETNVLSQKTHREEDDLDNPRGVLYKRKDFLEVEEEAKLHPERTYYFRKHVDVDKLIEQCTRRLKSSPNNFKALSIRASSYMKKKMYAEAVADYNKVLAIDKENVSACYNRGVAHDRIGKVDDAIKDFSAVLKLDSGHVNAAYSRAACYNRQGHFSQAIEDYSMALNKDRERSESSPGSALLSPHSKRKGSFLLGADQYVKMREQQALEQMSRSGASSPAMTRQVSDSRSSLNIALPEDRNYRTRAASSSSVASSVLSLGAGHLPAGFSSPAVSPSAFRSTSARRLSKNAREEASRKDKGNTVTSKQISSLPPTVSTKSFSLDDSMSPSNAAGLITPASTPFVHTVSGRSRADDTHISTTNQTGRSATASTPSTATFDGSASAVDLQSSRIQTVRSTVNRSNERTNLVPHDSLARSSRSQISSNNYEESSGTEAISQVTDSNTTSFSKKPIQPQSTADKFHAQGFAHRKRGDFDAAIAAYTRAIELDENHFKAYFNRGFAYDKLHRFRAAIADYTRALEIDPSNAYAHYNRGISYDRSGDFSAAVHDFSRAIDILPTNADFFHNRGFCYRKQGNYESAIADYTKAIELQPRHFKAMYNRAYSFERLGKFDRALEDYSSAIHMDSSNVNAYFNRGATYEKLDRLDEAIADFSRVIELDRKSASAYNSRGLVLDRIGQRENALKDFSDAITLEPNNTIFRHNRGFCYRALNRFHEAIQDFDIALKNDKTNAAGFSHRGYSWRKLGQFSNAIDDYSEAIKLEPHNIKLYNNRGYCYAKSNQYEQAIQDYTQVIELDHTNVHAFHNRGISYDKKGSFKEAIADFTRVLELDHNNANAYFNRGSTYDSLGQYDKAIEDYSRALALDRHQSTPTPLANNLATPLSRNGSVRSLTNSHSKGVAQMAPRSISRGKRVDKHTFGSATQTKVRSRQAEAYTPANSLRYSGIDRHTAIPNSVHRSHSSSALKPPLRRSRSTTNGI